jgi:hypothetical protein
VVVGGLGLRTRWWLDVVPAAALADVVVLAVAGPDALATEDDDEVDESEPQPASASRATSAVARARRSITSYRAAAAAIERETSSIGW